jgi:S-adenosylmethionine/arginine decarboxylase-like enzyme
MAHVEGTTTYRSDCYGCEIILTNGKNASRHVRDAVEKIIVENGLTIRGELLDVWDNGAFFLTIVLEESHITLTSYPEESEGYLIKVSVELCNYMKDNYTLTIVLAEKIVASLGPVLVEIYTVEREGPKPDKVLETRALLFSTLL